MSADEDVRDQPDGRSGAHRHEVPCARLARWTKAKEIPPTRSNDELLTCVRKKDSTAPVSAAANNMSFLSCPAPTSLSMAPRTRSTPPILSRATSPYRHRRATMAAAMKAMRCADDHMQPLWRWSERPPYLHEDGNRPDAHARGGADLHRCGVAYGPAILSPPGSGLACCSGTQLQLASSLRGSAAAEVARQGVNSMSLISDRPRHAKDRPY